MQRYSMLAHAGDKPLNASSSVARYAFRSISTTRSPACPSTLPPRTASCRFCPSLVGRALRSGTRWLIRDLRRQAEHLDLYLVGADPAYVRRWLMLYGIHVDGVVRQQPAPAYPGPERP